MASTTTLKLPAGLKQRLSALAEQSGKSPHGLMLEAIERHVEYEERMRAFVQEAMEADDREDIVKYANNYRSANGLEKWTGIYVKENPRSTKCWRPAGR